MRQKVYTLNAFTKNGKGGNPTGVVFDADDLTDDQMQKIAKGIKFAETAFVLKSDKADFRIRFFDPDIEVDLCGHATIATFYLMVYLNKIKPGQYTQETKAGKFNIEVKKDQTVLMDQALPQFLDKLEPQVVAEALNIKLEAIDLGLPIRIVSTGFPTILVPLKSQEILKKLQPDFKKYQELCHKKMLLHPFTT